MVLNITDEEVFSMVMMVRVLLSVGEGSIGG
jgi:hypothetical protein